MSHDDGGMKVMELGMEVSTVDTWSLCCKNIYNRNYDDVVVKAFTTHFTAKINMQIMTISTKKVKIDIYS